jgi:predicted acetyltransferase
VDRAVDYEEAMNDAEVSIREGIAEDWRAISKLLSHVFHHEDDPAARDVQESVFEPDRSLVADDNGLVVGHAAAYTRDLTVPGGVVPAAHVTLVGVAPTHRRQGVLTRMMHRQLREISAGGREPIAALWASEGKIYPRYGYGRAVHRLALDVSTLEVRTPVVTSGGRVRLVEPIDAYKLFAQVYETVRPDRPGWSTRDDRWWRSVLSDVPSARHGRTELHGAVHEMPDGPTGYAVWRTESAWAAGGPAGTVHVRELVAADPQAYATLWRFLLSTDLARSVTFDFATPDEPLLHLVDEPRRLGAVLTDSLWIRLVNLPGALAARRYAAPVDVVLQVGDPLLPENAGRWRLTGGPRGATCTPTETPADLDCTVLELGAAYLGGTSLAALADAGRVRELTPGTLAPAATAFGWHRGPAAIEVF